MKKNMLLKTLAPLFIFLGCNSYGQLKNFFLTTNTTTHRSCLIIGESHDYLSFEELAAIIPTKALQTNQIKILIELPKNQIFSHEEKESPLLAFKLLTSQSKNTKLVDFPLDRFPQMPKTKISQTALTEDFVKTFWQKVQSPLPAIESSSFVLTEGSKATRSLKKAFSLRLSSPKKSKLLLETIFKKYAPEIIHDVLSVCPTGMESRNQRFANKIKNTIKNAHAIFPVGHAHIQGIYDNLQQDSTHHCEKIEDITNFNAAKIMAKLDTH